MHTPKMLPPHYFLLSLVLMVGAGFVGGRGFIDDALVYLGLVPMLLGAALAVSASRQFSAAGTNIIPLSRSTVLVTRGAFQWSRNPMYLGMIMFLAGLALLLDNPWTWLVVVSFFVLIRQNFVFREEQLMTQTFGTEYEEFKSRVRRWI